jgi:predicted dehydrogenase
VQAWLQWASGAQMSLRLGRLLEARERRLTVLGTAGAACFDDSGPRPRLRSGPPVAEVALPEHEPLLAELDAFARALARPPVPGSAAERLCSGEGGLQVVQVLEACALSLRLGGQPVPVRAR